MSDLRNRIEALESAGGGADEVADCIEIHDATDEWHGRPSVIAKAQEIKGLILGIELNMTGEVPDGPTLLRHDR